jgi:hypothetical protein
MTQQTISGETYQYIPAPHPRLLWPLSAANATMDLGDEAVYFVGHAFLPGRTGTKTLSAGGGGSIWWMPGTVTFANGSTNLRIGLQDLDAAGGGPQRGDGTFDVYADLVGGTDTITTATWLQTVMESGTKDITHGGPLCIAFEMTTRGGADSVQVRGQTTSVISWPGVTLETAGPSYSAQGMIPSALILFDDATYGWIAGSFITSTGAMFTNTSVASNTAVNDEWGNIFTLPAPISVDALFCCVGVSTTSADFELILYSDPLGTPTVVEAITVDANHAQITSQRFFERQLSTVRSLAAGDYVVAIRPTTTNSVSITSFDVSTAAHMVTHPYGTNANLAKRLDNAGAFTETTTTRMIAGVRVCASADDASGGGGQRIISG